jgi:hypothetical protein
MYVSISYLVILVLSHGLRRMYVHKSSNIVSCACRVVLVRSGLKEFET